MRQGCRVARGPQPGFGATESGPILCLVDDGEFQLFLNQTDRLA